MSDQIITSDNQVTFLTSIADTQEATKIVSTTIDGDGNQITTELISSPEVTFLTSDAATSVTQIESGYVGGRGPQGIQGEQGIKGDTGNDGVDGFSAITTQPINPVHSDVWWDDASGILWVYYDPELTGIGVWIEVGRPGPTPEVGLLPESGAEGNILTIAGGIPAWTVPSDYQAPLISGTNLKTINNISLLGGGDIVTGDVTLTDSQTLTNKTLASPTINNPTGITKDDVGLGNVDNTSNATERTATATLTNKDLSSNTNTFPASLAKTTANTFTGAQIGGVSSLTSSAASISIDLSSSNNFSHTTSEDTILALPSNPVAGQSGVITITQGATPRLLAYHTFWRFPGGAVPTLTAVSGAVDLIAYYVESGTRATCQLIKDSK